jgi:hypothetical protein
MRIKSFVTALLLLGCQTFDPPPEVTIQGSENGVMTTQPGEPFVLLFSEPIKQNTFRTKLVKAVFDGEGNLQDETEPPDFEGFKANTLVAFDGADPESEDLSYGATFTLTDTQLSMEVGAGFQISAPYLALIEPHLEDKDGHFTEPRQRLPFTFQLEGGGPTTLPTGYYYWLFDISPPPLQTQIQVFVYMKVDPVTGQWRANFTNANRRAALNSRPGCPSCADLTPICALIPSPRCVKPSDKQNDILEWVDFLPEPDPPDGYYFIADGFARDEADGKISLGTAPFLIDINIGSGNINIRAENTKVIGAFEKDANDRLVASGSVSIDVVKVNGSGKDPTDGVFKAIKLSDEEVATIEGFGYPIPTDLEQ